MSKKKLSEYLQNPTQESLERDKIGTPNTQIHDHPSGIV